MLTTICLLLDGGLPRSLGDLELAALDMSELLLGVLEKTRLEEGLPGLERLLLGGAQDVIVRAHGAALYRTRGRSVRATTETERQ